MPTVRLSAKSLPKLKATGTQTDYFDRGANVPGFGLRVSAKGRRVWFLLYRVNGRLKRHTIGTHPPMKLEAARTAARRQQLGIQVEDADPVAAKKARRSAMTFEDLGKLYLENYAKGYAKEFKKKSWREDARQIRSLCLPRWRKKAADEIKRSDVSALLDDVAMNRGGVTANRLLSLLSKIFRWAIAKGHLESNPVAGLPKPVTERARERQLSDDEIRHFWTALDSADDPAVGLWLRLRLLTGQRGSNVQRMQWAHIDFDRKVWEIPASEMKAGKAHVVPLSQWACDLLTERRKIVSDDAVYVLQGGRSRRKRQGATDLIELEDFQLRDLRRTCATGMARAGASRFIVGKVLGHKDRSITGIYDRFEYLNEKRVALDTWARTLKAIVEDKEKSASSVVPFVAKGV